MKDNRAPSHVKRATSLVHRYERTLREILDAAMSYERHAVLGTAKPTTQPAPAAPVGTNGYRSTIVRNELS